MSITYVKSNQDIPAIILAGGLGTRLREVVQDLPKPMAPIGNLPFLHYVFCYLKKQGITHAVLSVGYKNEVIRQFLGKEYLGITVSYAEENEPLGTGGGIREAFRYVDGLAFVINGDTFFDVPLNELREFYFQKNADIAFSLKRLQKFDRYGTVEVNSECQALEFAEKKYCEEGLINGGVYLFDKRIFDRIERREDQDLPYKFSFEKDVLERQVHRMRFFGKEFDRYFIDIGIPDDYRRAADELPALFTE